MSCQRLVRAGAVGAALLALGSPGAARDGEAPGAAQAAAAVSQESRWIVPLETPFGTAYASVEAPAGHYAESYAGEYYWVPGVARGSPLIRRILATARRTGRRGALVRLNSYQVSGAWVHMTSAPPYRGVHHRRAGRWYAWIAGVRSPSDAQARAIGEALASHAAGAASRALEPTADPDWDSY